jgi:hypothetical protein
MTQLVQKNFGSPQNVRPFADGTGQLELRTPGSGPVGRAILEPGWQWSKHVKPCQRHANSDPLAASEN